MSRTALFVSPHLDDAVFSCGGTLARLSAEGWHTVLCTPFTGSVPNPTGFALSCQTDKGLPPYADYMEIRRAEDREAARILGVSTVVHLPYLEAPHRGYHSPGELFGPVLREDNVWEELINAMHRASPRGDVEVTYVPQGIGGHVDHVQVIAAFNAAGWDGLVRWYRDTPYVIRAPAAARSGRVPAAGKEILEVFSEEFLQKKIAACAAYSTQINFQFGGVNGVREKLTALAEQEAAVAGLQGFAERFWETGEAS